MLSANEKTELGIIILVAPTEEVMEVVISPPDCGAMFLYVFLEWTLTGVS
jgi:hypothetical protein